MNLRKHIALSLCPARKFRCLYILAVMIQILAAILLFPRISTAELKSMSSEDMKTATAQAGFTEFSLNKDTARLFLDIHVETYATIDSFSGGYYNGGWDQKWNQVQIGASADNPLVVDGLVFIADFEEGSLNSGSTPVLERVVIGSNRLQGSISAILNSYTGIYSSALTGGGSPDAILSRENLAGAGGTDRTTFTFDSNATGDKGLFFILNIDSSNVGFQVVAGYNEKNIPVTPSGPWWDSP